MNSKLFQLQGVFFFWHRLSIISIYDSPNPVFHKGLFQVSGERVVYLQHQFDRAQKSACYLRLLFFLKS